MKYFKKAVVLLIAAIILIYFLFAKGWIIFSANDDCGTTVCQLGSTLIRLGEEQKKIDDIILKKEKLDSSYEVRSSDADSLVGWSKWHVDKEGNFVIVLKSGAVLIAKRNVIEGKSNWSCQIFPEEFTNKMTEDCGGRYYK